MEYKINQKIWEIEIRNPVTESCTRKNGIAINECKIIGISVYKICINTDWFHTFYILNKGERRDSYKNYIDDISVSIRTDDHLLGNGVFITLYSSKKPTKRTLNKMVAKAAVEIDNKYGFLYSGAKDELYNFVSNYKI